MSTQERLSSVRLTGMLMASVRRVMSENADELRALRSLPRERAIGLAENETDTLILACLHHVGAPGLRIISSDDEEVVLVGAALASQELAVPRLIFELDAGPRADRVGDALHRAVREAGRDADQD